MPEPVAVPFLAHTVRHHKRPRRVPLVLVGWLAAAFVALLVILLLILLPPMPMRIQQLLDHYGIASNPFADEDAQTDLVFKGACIRNTFHPTWDKIYGDPSEPATAVVFGEKGSGKTAIRLQLARHLADYNAEHPDKQVFVVAYDDFNAFLDRFRDRFSGRRRRAERMLEQWRLWDHIDAILSLAVTQLTDRILENRQARHPAARDEAAADRPARRRAAARRDAAGGLLRPIDRREPVSALGPAAAERLRFRTWRSKWDIARRDSGHGRGDRLPGVAAGLVVVRVALALPGDCGRLGAAGLAAAAVVVDRPADHPQLAGLEPLDEAALPDAVELPRRPRSSASRCPPRRGPTTATSS